MNDPAPVKVCPLCAETIKAFARICPFCQSRQGRFVFWWYEYAIFAMAAVLLAMVLTAIAFVFPDDKSLDGRFSWHRSDLLVPDNTLSGLKSDPSFSLSGEVTNQSRSAWRVHELEVRIQDRQGNLLDVRNPKVSDPFVVLPGRAHAFQVNLRGTAFTNSDIAAHVRVQVATDGDRPWNSD